MSKININTSHTRGDNAWHMLNMLLTAPRAEHGVDWYAEQREEISRMADTLGVSREVFTAVVSHLSPQTKWEQNLSYAYHVVALWLHGGTADMAKSLGLPVFGGNIDKAFKVLDTADPFAAKYGPKTKSFYLNLMGDPNAVTVDRHHAMIMLGVKEFGDVAITPAAYADMVHLTQVAARMLNMTPAELQASLWVARRG